MKKLVLLRHGESIWNKENLFTGWTDVELSEKGTQEAIDAGRTLRAEGYVFDVAYTSVLKRAIKTLERGQIIAVTATDKGACRDIPAWAEQTGHKLLSWDEQAGIYTFYIEKAGWEDD